MAAAERHKKTNIRGINTGESHTRRRFGSPMPNVGIMKSYCILVYLINRHDILGILYTMVAIRRVRVSPFKYGKPFNVYTESVPFAIFPMNTTVDYS